MIRHMYWPYIKAIELDITRRLFIPEPCDTTVGQFQREEGYFQSGLNIFTFSVELFSLNPFVGFNSLKTLFLDLASGNLEPSTIDNVERSRRVLWAFPLSRQYTTSRRSVLIINIYVYIYIYTIRLKPKQWREITWRKARYCKLRSLYCLNYSLFVFFGG